MHAPCRGGRAPLRRPSMQRRNLIMLKMEYKNLRRETASAVSNIIAEEAVGAIPLTETCAACQRTFTSKRGLSVHQRMAHPVEPPKNPDKCKIMKIGKWNDTGGITIGGNEIETVDAFCYLGSILTDYSSCDKEIKARIGKANVAFGKLE